jgi:type I site-specific restriction-modification system R (restriction) subunit
VEILAFYLALISGVGPCLHTMYVDKPMHGHGLMQAIARVNRVFRDKPGGLVVDYLGLADALRQAMAIYAQSGGKGQTALDQEEALKALRTKYEVCRGLFYGFVVQVDHGLAGRAPVRAAGGARAHPEAAR